MIILIFFFSFPKRSSHSIRLKITAIIIWIFPRSYFLSVRLFVYSWSGSILVVLLLKAPSNQKAICRTLRCISRRIADKNQYKSRCEHTQSANTWACAKIGCFNTESIRRARENKNFVQFTNWMENIESEKIREWEKNIKCRLCSFPKTTRCTYGAHTNRKSEKKISLLFTQEKSKKRNYMKREVTAVHEGNRKHSRLTVSLSLSFAFLALDTFWLLDQFVQCVITLTS